MIADLVDFVALSLLPLSMWRAIGARLRAGEAPATATGGRLVAATALVAVTSIGVAPVVLVPSETNK